MSKKSKKRKEEIESKLFVITGAKLKEETDEKDSTQLNIGHEMDLEGAKV